MTRQVIDDVFEVAPDGEPARRQAHWLLGGPAAVGGIYRLMTQGRHHGHRNRADFVSFSYGTSCFIAIQRVTS